MILMAEEDNVYIRSIMYFRSIHRRRDGKFCLYYIRKL